jgi:hypothetical protein
VPVVAPYSPSLPAEGPARVKVTQQNPHLPLVDPGSQGVGNAVVLLRGIEPKRGRPWDHPPLEVEQRDYRLRVRQGETASPFGFVRCGDAIDMVSRQKVLHALHAGGASFFTLMFPDPEQPLRRRLDHKGLVELSSGAGYYWMRAYLFVDDHPYYARTDTAGRFTLTQVPPGRYRLVCWMPSWHEVRRERDPENGQIWRVVFRPPVEQVREITVDRAANCDEEFTLSAELFER